MSQVLGGYFGDLNIARIFIEVGIRPILGDLPKKIRVADVGGGQGLLVTTVRDYLVDEGFEVEAYVVDSNPDFIKECERKNLKVSLADIRDCPLKDIELVIMRAVLHYNSVAHQYEILQAIKKLLSPSGKLVAQLLTGSTINCNLRKEIISLSSLGEGILNGYYNSQDFEDLSLMLNAIGFHSVSFMGPAPHLRWTLEQQWMRLNGPITSPFVTEEVKNNPAQFERFQLFKREVKAIINRYVDEFGIDSLNVDFANKENPVIQNDYQIFCCSNV
jgi:hypothetical protein